MILDVVIICVMLVSAVIAFFRGLINEVLTIVGLGGAALGAFMFGGLAVPMFTGWIVNPDDEDYKFFDAVPDDIVAEGAAYLAVFILIFIVLSVLGHFLSKGANAIGLGPVDRSLGVIFGLLRGAILIMVLYLPFAYVVEPDEFPEFVTESKLMPVVQTGADQMMAMLDLGTAEDEEVQDAEDAEETTNDKKMSDDMIDKVRKEYIGDAPPATSPENTESGYGETDRDALNDLIEDNSNE